MPKVLGFDLEDYKQQARVNLDSYLYKIEKPVVKASPQVIEVKVPETIELVIEPVEEPEPPAPEVPTVPPVSLEDIQRIADQQLQKMTEMVEAIKSIQPPTIEVTQPEVIVNVPPLELPPIINQSPPVVFPVQHTEWEVKIIDRGWGNNIDTLRIKVIK